MNKKDEIEITAYLKKTFEGINWIQYGDNYITINLLKGYYLSSKMIEDIRKVFNKFGNLQKDSILANNDRLTLSFWVYIKE